MDFDPRKSRYRHLMLEGTPLPEIARALGVSVGTIRAWLRLDRQESAARHAERALQTEAGEGWLKKAGKRRRPTS